jgi:hypothetical protein
VDAYQELYDLYEEKAAAGLADAERPIGRGTAFQQAEMVLVTTQETQTEKDETTSPRRPGLGFGRKEVKAEEE